MSNYRLLEQKSIYLSIATTFSMAIFGISVSIWIQSDAVMLDGIFNAINCAMAIASLWITKLIQKPENKSFNFGYSGFIPLLNLCKGILVFAVSVFALTSALMALFHGGTEAKAGKAVIYAIIAATVCLSVTVIQKGLAKKTNSPIVKVDAQNWFINGMISLAVGVSFGIASFLSTTPFKNLVPYADPTIVTILVLIAFPIPVSVILSSLKQLMLGSANEEIQTKVNGLVAEFISQYPFDRYALRMTEVGQVLYLHFYWLLSPDNNISMAEIDQIRLNMIKHITQEYSNITVDIIFTQDREWFFEMNDHRGVKSIENPVLA